MRCDNFNTSHHKRRPQGCLNNPGLKSSSSVAESDATPAWSDNPNSIISYISAQYKAVFFKPEPIHSRLKALIDLNHNLQTNMKTLCQLRNEEQELMAAQQQITLLFNAISQNDTYIWRRAYFLEFVNLYQLSFDALLTAASKEQKDELMSRKTQLEREPDRWAKVASTIFAPLIVLSRMGLPSRTQEALNEYLPQTLDAQAKQLIKKVAQDVLERLANAIKEVNAKKQNMHPDLEQLIQKESSESINQYIALNALSEEYEDLEPLLSEQPKSPVPVLKMHIQELIQRYYLQMMNGCADERQKMDVLRIAMQETVVRLDHLIELSAKKEELISQYLPIKALSCLFIEHTSNAFIGTSVKGSLAILNEKISELDKKIEDQAYFCARGDNQLKTYLQQSSAEYLRVLQQSHRIDQQMETLLITSITTLTPDPLLLEADSALQEYFNQQYIALINQDRSEEERVAHLIEYMKFIETQLIGIQRVREEEDNLTIKIAQVSEVLDLLEKQKNESMFTQLMKQRLKQLHEMAKQVNKRKEELLHILSQGNNDLKNKLTNRSYKVFDAVINEHKALTECAKEYLKLKQKIQLLVELRKGDSLISDFIIKQESWWVWLTNFLAQFFACFQTEAGDRVNKAKALKLEISNLSIACEQEILTHIENIEKMKPSPLGRDLLSDLPVLTDYKRTQRSQTFDPDRALSLLANVSLFKPSDPSSMKRAAEGDEADLTAGQVCYL